MLHRYVIERDLPGGGNLSEAELREISRMSSGVLHDMWPGIEWVQSYVTADRLYCVYLAENEQLVREHAERGGFPCTRISRVVQVIDPVTASMRRP
jgi:hypothetical protein